LITESSFVLKNRENGFALISPQTRHEIKTPLGIRAQRRFSNPQFLALPRTW